MALILFATAFSFTSCDSSDSAKETLSEEQIKLRIDNILSEIKAIGNESGKIVKYKFENLKKDDYMSYFDVLENSEKIIAFTNGTNPQAREEGDNYKVTCTYGDGEVVVTECGENVGCAGQATYDCLEGGGCATICNNKAELSFTPAQ
ncbi:hypothetical protein [Psychroserpens algicola]|uniref:hypothetical protein n=1 Tax=Psychroserpens algicola TaxID=1719034 RepID=UPI0019530B01|nr:hypothetical protein [Psychroserpens algicola]